MAKYLFILGRDDNEAATRCFQFAKVAKDKNHEVEIFYSNMYLGGAPKIIDIAEDAKVFNF